MKRVVTTLITLSLAAGAGAAGARSPAPADPADQRACLAALENLHAKYAVTAAEIEQRRDAATARLKGFLGELGYE